MTRVLVLRGLGFNCEDETEAAYRAAGAEAVVVHAARFLADPRLDGASVLHVSGGFTFGDELGAGQVFALRLREDATTWRAITRFLDRGGRIVGVCNGFQILARAGLTPNVGEAFEVEAALAPNAGGRFVDRWVTCAPSGVGVARLGAAAFDLPIRHGEGRLVFRDAGVREAVRARGLVALRYTDDPNGAEDRAAALWSADGRVLGMMPHPEACLAALAHPAWPTRARLGAAQPDDEGDGLRLLRRMLAAFAKEALG